jgi:hypothetical protein
MTPGMPKRVRSVENIESLSLSREPLCPPLPFAASARLGYVPVTHSENADICVSGW